MWASIHMEPPFEGLLQSSVDSSPSDESCSSSSSSTTYPELIPRTGCAAAAGGKEREKKKVIRFHSVKVIYKYSWRTWKLLLLCPSGLHLLLFICVMRLAELLVSFHKALAEEVEALNRIKIIVHCRSFTLRNYINSSIRIDS